MREDVKGLLGGTKSMYLRVHRDEILVFWEKNGDHATKQEYNFRENTLDSFLRTNGITAKDRIKTNNYHPPDYDKLAEAAQRAQANAVLAKARVEELEKVISRLVKGNGVEVLKNEDKNRTRALFLAKIARESAIETSRQVAELQRQYEKFVPLVADQITRKFLIPLLSTIIDLPPEFEQQLDDRLSLTGIRQLARARQCERK